MENLDFYTIVVNGFSHNQEFILDYFEREMIKAKEQHYSNDEFIAGCRNIPNLFIEEINSQVNKEKGGWYDLLAQLREELANTDDPIKKEELQKRIDDAKDWLAGIKPENYCVNLFSHNRGFTGNIFYDRVKEMKLVLDRFYIITIGKHNLAVLEERLEKPLPLTDETENPLIFDQMILLNFYWENDDKLWNKTDTTTFLNWFRVTPIGKIDFKKNKKSDFGRKFGKIVDLRNKEICSNIGVWVKKHDVKSNYSTLKNSQTNAN